MIFLEIIVFVTILVCGCKVDEKSESIAVNFNESKSITVSYQATIRTQGKLGVVKFDSEKGLLIYTPNENAYGTDIFVLDNSRRKTKYIFNVNIKEPRAIEVENDSLICTEDKSIEINSVLDNDETEVIGPLEFEGFSDLKNGEIEKQGNTYFFIPHENFHGEGGFTYKVKDALGRIASGYAKVKITSAPDEPLAKDDKVEGYNDETIVIDILNNDSDIDGDDIDLVQVSHYSNGNPLGSMEIKNDKLYYTPFQGKIGIDKFQYTIKDNSTAGLQAKGIVTIGLIARDSTLNKTISTDEDNAISLSIPGDSIQINDKPGNGSISSNEDKIIYSPEKDFSGEDSFTLFFRNYNNGTGYMKVKVKVNPVNDVPIAKDDEYTLVDTKSEHTLDVVKNDLDIDGDNIIITSVGSSNNGELTIKNNKLVYKVTTASLEDTFTYGISDGNGGNATATVKLTIVPPKPEAVDDNYAIDEDLDVFTCDVLKNDSYSQLKSINILDVKFGTVAIRDNKIFYYTAKDFNGLEEIKYTISDNLARTSSPASVFITISPKEDEPVALNDTYTVDEDSENNELDVLANDRDADGDTLSIVVHSITTNQGGTVNLLDNKLVYTPASNFNGIETISYTIDDGNGGTSTANVTVTVTPVNDPPTAVADTYTAAEDSAENKIDVLSNDSDIDGDTLSIVADSLTTNHGGTVIASDNKLVYAPANNFNGVETINYTIDDGNGGTSRANVTVTVTPVNDPPTAVADTYTAAEDSEENQIDVLSNDSDIDGDTLSIVADSLTTNHGGTVIASDNKLVYTPANNFNGVETINYTIDDGNGGTSTANVTVTVTPVNDPPTAVADTIICEVFYDLDFLLGNDYDIDNDTLTFKSSTYGEYGKLIIEGSQFYYEPGPDFTTHDTLTYTIQDVKGETSIATITVTAGY